MNQLQTIKINTNDVVALTMEQAKARYNLGSNMLYKISDKAGANIYITPRKRLYSRIKLDRYFEEELVEG